MPSQLMQRYFEFVSQRPGHILAPLLLIVLVAVIYLVVQGARRKRQRDYEEDLARGIPAEPPARPFPWVRGFIAAVAMAAFYLVIFRVISLMPPFYRDQKGGAILMSFSFLFLGPFVAGVITVAQATRKDPWPVSAWVLAPWIPVLANMLLALAVAWEGIICVVFIVPPAMISASLGGILAGALQRHWHRAASRRTLYCFAALPLLMAVAETHLDQPLRTRTVDTSVVIHASAAVVWQNIERVPAIGPAELRRSWANAIGFPRPVEATLSHEGVGGVRNATFERGLKFTETITEWVPNQRIVFTIKADTAAIPTTTLDEHVTVGGRFFDVLTGEYDLQTLPNGDTLLHLSSQERLSTDFNAYAAMWSDAVMRDMQSNILHVIRNRCERA